MNEKRMEEFKNFLKEELSMYRTLSDNGSYNIKLQVSFKIPTEAFEQLKINELKGMIIYELKSCQRQLNEELDSSIIKIDFWKKHMKNLNNPV